MSDAPVTILMPAFNAERYVAAAVESVRAQTHCDFELLVIDDGSADRTPEIVATIAANDPRVRLVRQPNAGAAHAMNRGLKLARSGWVFVMHADDLMLPNRVERQLAFLRDNPDVAVASALVYYIDPAGRTIGKGRSPFVEPAAVERAVREGQVISFSHPAGVLRREVVLAAGGYRQAFWPAEDSELWTRLAGLGHRVAVQGEHLLKYRIHGSSASVGRNRLMQQKMLWIEDCVRRRRAGAPELDWDGFLASRRREPWPVRLNQGRREWGHTLYQASLAHLSARSFHRFVPALLGAAALEPRLVLSRVLPRLGLMKQ